MSMENTFFKKFLILICIAITAWLMARTTFYFRNIPIALDATPSVAAVRPDAARETVASFSAIAERNLLGALVAAPDAQSARSADNARYDHLNNIPVSQNSWILLGTILDAADPGSSRAVLSVDGRQQVYRAGTEVQGWQLAKIQRGVVVITQGDKVERLVFAGGIVGAGLTQKPDIQKNVSRARLQREFGDITALMRVLTIMPEATGEHRGLRIVDIRKGSYLDELGLKQDDLLLGANNAPLTNFGDMARLFDLMNKDVVNLEVLRNGRKNIIRFDLQN